MLVKDLMDDKQLDLDKPLLSVRRQVPVSRVSSQRYGDSGDKRSNGSRFSIPRLPLYKPELKSGPIRNPGSVPFQWEKTPGLPKEEDIKPQVGSQVAPKLPPGRVSGRGIKNAETGKSQFGSMRGSFVNEERNSSSSEEFVDAPDTLSISGSSYLNCSMSGFTGMDDLDANSIGGNFSSDPKTQGLMMERFLPAAKALVSEKPKYSPRKQASVREPLHPQKVKQTALKPTLRYGPSFAMRYSHFGIDATDEDEVDENENEEAYDDDHRYGRIPLGCGLLPRLLKGSVFHNPVPGSSMRMRRPFSPSKATRTRPESSSSSSLNEAESSERTTGLSALKTSQDKVSEKGSDSGSIVSEKTVYVDTVQNVGTVSFSSNNGVLVSGDKYDEIVTKRINQIHVFDASSEDADKLPVKSEQQALKLDSEEPQQGSAPVEKPEKKYSQLPVAPPLPKSPTDSWLFRTLPSISKNPSTRSFLSSATNPQKNGFKVVGLQSEGL